LAIPSWLLPSSAWLWS